MARTMKPGPFKRLLEQAAELGIEHSVNGPDDESGIYDLKLRIQEAAADPIEVDDSEETVVVRIHEWTEWIPATADQTGKLAMSSGMTMFKTANTERVIDIGVSGTGLKHQWDQEEECPECEGSGKVTSDEVEKECEPCGGTGNVMVSMTYGLYAFQAVLAHNAPPQLANALQQAQFKPMYDELERAANEGDAKGRDRREDLLVVENGRQAPNRAQRRSSKKRS